MALLGLDLIFLGITITAEMRTRVNAFVQPGVGYRTTRRLQGWIESVTTEHVVGWVYLGTIPAGATIKQVLLYWGGQDRQSPPGEPLPQGDDTIEISTTGGAPFTEVLGTTIGGPTRGHAGGSTTVTRAASAATAFVAATSTQLVDRWNSSCSRFLRDATTGQRADAAAQSG